MPLTLSDIIVQALMDIGQLGTSLATGGSTTTIVDSTLDPENATDDDYKGGLAVVMRDAGGAGAAPEGQFSRITAFAADSGTFTFSPAMTVAPAAGDRYGYTSPQYPLQEMIVLANRAMQALGDMPLVDITTLDTVSMQTEYAASVAWKRTRPYQIDIQTWTTTAGNNEWVTIHDWDWVPAAGGATGLIVFRTWLTAERVIRVWYKDVHPELNAFSDVINERIDPELAVKTMILMIRNWMVERDDGSDTALQQKWNKAKSEQSEVQLVRPIEQPPRKTKLLIVRDRMRRSRTHYDPNKGRYNA